MVFVLDTQHIVVAGRPQGIDETPPPTFVMPVTQSHIVPRARCDLIVRLRLQEGVRRGVAGVDQGVLGMNVEDRAGKVPRGVDRIAPHPHDMAGVQVSADIAAAGVTQPPKGFGIVDKLGPMVFEGDAHNAEVAPERGQLAPIRNGDLLPLPAQNLLISQPGVARTVARANDTPR